ncbi:MAG: PTS sugar transporter subunit IIA [Erysipelotrichaceae bacterium]|nr:PTS sugar transporter subunit IIA [Erysipelotrichaceae bacterium]
MVGILLLSHGKMAEGLSDTVSMFFGNEIERFAYLCLKMEDDPDAFGSLIKEKLEELNDGDGVLVFCDLFAGTPTHQMTQFLSDKVRVITGMNLPLVMETLGNRLSDNGNDIDTLIETGRAGIQEWKPADTEQNDEDFFI